MFISGRGQLVHLLKWGITEKANSVSVDRCHIVSVRNQYVVH